MNLTLKVWRQKDANDARADSSTYEAKDVLPDMSFLEMLDVVNEGLIAKGEEPIAFDSDCREGICGTCSLVINGVAHGGQTRHDRLPAAHAAFPATARPSPSSPGARARFPVLKDLVTDRSAFDRIIQAGGFVSVNTGGTPDANALPSCRRPRRDQAMDAAACIGCGACVAACKNASAMLFVSAKVSHLASCRRAKSERDRRVAEHGRTDGRGRLRQLHRDRLLRGGLPEGNQSRLHRPHEPRVWRRPPQRCKVDPAPFLPTILCPRLVVPRWKPAKQT